MSNYEDEDYFLPLEDQRVFGAGITRKRVPFVRSSEHELTTTTTTTSSASYPSTPTHSTGTSIANKYLSIVMPNTPPPPPPTSTSTSSTSTESTPSEPSIIERTHSAPPTTEPPPSTKCEICNLPLSPDTDTIGNTTSPNMKPHEASLAHQVCLTHSHPPSHLDRTRAGLRYLESYGWDPDSRVGLGAPGREGIREPVKGRVKVDTVGLGAEERIRNMTAEMREKIMRKKKKGVEKMNAKEVRKGQAEMRRKGEVMREMFYRSEDVLKYLGEK